MGRFCFPLNNGRVTHGFPLSDQVVLNNADPVYSSPLKASPGALGVIIKSKLSKTESISFFKMLTFLLLLYMMH